MIEGFWTLLTCLRIQQIHDVNRYASLGISRDVPEDVTPNTMPEPSDPVWKIQGYSYRQPSIVLNCLNWLVLIYNITLVWGISLSYRNNDPIYKCFQGNWAAWISTLPPQEPLVRKCGLLQRSDQCMSEERSMGSGACDELKAERWEPGWLDMKWDLS